MKNALDQVAPAGRIDVLVFRMLERLGERVCPREWPAFRSHVEKWARKQFGPKPQRRRRAA